MVYKFWIISEEVDNFKMEIAIDSDDTFYRLRNVILESVNYTKDQLDSFFICDDRWHKEKEVTLEDMGSDSDEDIWLMEDTLLSELIEDEGQKMIYVFDYMTERSFFMELKEVMLNKTLKDPLCQRKEGEPPAQVVDEREFLAKMKVATPVLGDDDLDADFYGEDNYNDDELENLEGIEDVVE